jgi:hypothetical protein
VLRAGLRGPIPMIISIAALMVFISPGALGADNPLLGRWQVTEAAVAPWATDKRAAPSSEARRLINMQIAFSAKGMKSGYATLNCSDASFEVRSDPPDVLFQAGLPEPNQAQIAESMGFPRGDVPGVEVSCSAGEFPFHFRDADTVMFALNDVIYTLKRH